METFRVSDDRSDRSDYRFGDRWVSQAIILEMQSIVREAAVPAIPGETVKAAIGRAARRLQLGFGRARRYWYGEVRAVPAQEADRLRAIRKLLLEERLRRMDSEMERIRERLGELEREDTHRIMARGILAVDRESGDRAV